MKTTAEERIRDFVGNLYLSEPLYQRVALSHKIIADKNIKTIAVGKREIHYNPAFISGLSDNDFRFAVFTELDRILLKHPYERQKKNRKAHWYASTIAIDDSTSRCLPANAVTSHKLHAEIVSMGLTEDQQKFLDLYAKYSAMSDDELKAKTGLNREKLAAMRSAMNIPTEEEFESRAMEYYYNIIDKHIEAQEGLSRIGEGVPRPRPGEGENQNGGEGEGEENKSSNEDEQKDGKPKGRKSKKNEEDKEEDKEEEESNCNEDGNGEDDSDDESSGESEGDGEGEEESTPGIDEYVAPTDTDELTKDWGEDCISIADIDSIIRDAAVTNQWGSVGGNFRERLIASLNPKVDYKSILKQFRQRVLSSDYSLNRMRPNRRFGFGFPGKKREYTTRLAMFVDTSASVSSTALADACGVMNNIFRYGIQEFDVFWFDTKVDPNVVQLSHVQKEFHPSGRGGTDFQVVFDFIKDEKKDYDGVIVFTDGECYVPNLKGFDKRNVCWLVDTEKHYDYCKDKLKEVGRVAFVKGKDDED